MDYMGATVTKSQAATMRRRDLRHRSSGKDRRPVGETMKARRIGSGVYEYRGFTIRLLDRSYTDGKTVWHVVQDNQIIDAASTLRGAKSLIDGWDERSK